MTRVKAVSVRVVEIITEDGTPLGLFGVESEWQGMRRLVRLTDPHPPRVVNVESIPSLIVDLPPGGDSGVFGPAFGEYRAVLDVVKASPSLADKLL